MSVLLREVNQVQVTLELFSLLSLHNSRQIDEGQVLLLGQFPCLLLISLQNDAVLTIDHLRVAHLVVELVWVSQLSSQSKFLCTNVVLGGEMNAY